jgi:hypothetical protein
LVIQNTFAPAKHKNKTMKKIILYLVIAATAINFSGCKKDSTTTETPTLYGLWQVTTTSASFPDLKFIKFNTNKSLAAYSESVDGFRSIVANNCSPTVDQVIANINLYTPVVYNYTVVGDVLTLIGDNGLPAIIATKSTATDAWVADVTSTDHIDGLFTNNGEGIGYDGTNLLFCDYSNGEIMKVSLATRTNIGTFPATSSVHTVEFDGTNYWESSNGSSTIRKVDALGTTLTTSTAMGPWIYGIGYVSPTSIICYSNNARTLYNYNPATDVVTSNKALTNINLGDVAVSNGKVYAAQNGANLIYRLNPTTFAVEKTYRITDAISIYGIASVGGGIFWLNTNSGEKVLKVELN